MTLGAWKDEVGEEVLEEKSGDDVGVEGTTH